MREKSNSLFKQNSQQPHVFRGGEIKVMKKKIAAFVLATALVLPISVPAFAATPSDVVGKPVQSSVEELTALGIIQGYEDGTFKPENQITRAELAKIIVIASGNEGAANLMASVKPAFTDVKASQWYTGYINAAAAKGYIVGYNGKFRPSDSVKFEEVVAILVRSLGYKESQLSGAWPYNYLLAAQDTKDGSLFEGLDITPGTTANRGIVARLTSNTINAKTVTYTGTNGDVVTYGDKLVTKIGETSKAVVSAATLTSDKEISLDGALVKTSDKFVVTGGKALADLVGHTVTVVKTKDKKQVLAVTDAQASDKIVAIENDATADTVGYNTYIVDKNSKSYTTVGTGKYLGFQDNFVNQVIGTNLAAAKKATLFLNDDGQVQFVSVVTYTEDKLVTGYEAKTSFRDARVNYATNASVSIKDSTSVKLNGVVASAADLKENDVIRFVLSGTSAVILEATRETVTGKVEQVKVEGGKYYYTVSGKVYEDLFATSSATALTLNSEYTLLLNKDGKIAGSKAASANTSSNYAVAIETAVPNVSVIENGEVKPGFTKLEVFSVKENKNVVVYLKPTDITGNIVDNSIVKLTYNSDGKVTKAAVTSTSAATGVIVKDVTATTIATTTNSTYYVNSNTVYLDASNRGDNVVSVATAAKVTKNDVIAVVLNSNNVNADLVVLVSDSDAANTETTVRGTYVSKYSVASGSTTSYFVTLNVKGTETPLAVTQTAYDDITATAKHQIVTLTDLVGGKYNGASNATPNVTALTDVSSSNSTFKATVGGTAKDYIVSPGTTVYSVDKDGKVIIDTFGAISAVVGGVIGTDFNLYVVASDNVVGGTYTEAAVVVVKLLK
ncbi:hypothetical protein FHS16_004694 [Paenibacillus endophyticus]|uniref:SLH domain-containing protein n=1 Tax=Paenibacillus endophyticus TaxID=1294268 RepID=A0A7W5CBM9_9BACL|nr:S-layer homology domain-containing protein [Paenibacillus endophyticus]MBB3154612.1 hypothetical protein [Paenibacillus endophyticus]